MTPDWIIAVCAALTFLVIIVGALWNFGRKVDSLIMESKEVFKTLERHLVRLDKHRDQIADLDRRVSLIEGRLGNGA